MTGSNFDHIGLIYKDNFNGCVYIFDSKPGEGVNKSEWKLYIDYNNLYTHVAYRKLYYN